MKKELIFALLFAISLLLSGCQETVGSRAVHPFCDETDDDRYDPNACASIGGDTGNIVDEGGMSEQDEVTRSLNEKLEMEEIIKELYGDNIRIGGIEDGVASVEVLDTRGNQIGAFVYDSVGVTSTAQREPEGKTEYVLVQLTNDFPQDSGNPETAKDDFEKFLQGLDGVELVGPMDAAVKDAYLAKMEAEFARLDKLAYEKLKELMNLPKPKNTKDPVKQQKAMMDMMDKAKDKTQKFADEVLGDNNGITSSSEMKSALRFMESNFWKLADEYVGDKDGKNEAYEKDRESQAMIEKYYNTNPGIKYYYDALQLSKVVKYTYTQQGLAVSPD